MKSRVKVEIKYNTGSPFHKKSFWPHTIDSVILSDHFQFEIFIITHKKNNNSNKSRQQASSCHDETYVPVLYNCTTHQERTASVPGHQGTSSNHTN